MFTKLICLLASITLSNIDDITSIGEEIFEYQSVSDTLYINGLCGLLVYPFGEYYDYEELKNAVPHDIPPQEDFILRNDGEHSDLVWLFKWKNSISAYRRDNEEGSRPDSYFSRFTLIQDEGISLIRGIHIGMTRQEFLSSIGLMDNKLPQEFRIVVCEANFFGEIGYFYFEQNKLKYIFINLHDLIDESVFLDMMKTYPAFIDSIQFGKEFFK